MIVTCFIRQASEAERRLSYKNAPTYYLITYNWLTGRTSYYFYNTLIQHWGFVGLDGKGSTEAIERAGCTIRPITLREFRDVAGFTLTAKVLLESLCGHRFWTWAQFNKQPEAPSASDDVVIVDSNMPGTCKE